MQNEPRGWKRALATGSCSLVRVQPGSDRRLIRLARRAVTAGRRPHNVAALFFSMALMTLFALAGVAMPAIAVLGVGLVYYGFAVGAEAMSASLAQRLDGAPGPPLEPEVAPEEIWAPDLRGSYRVLLDLHERIRCSLRDSERICDISSGLYARCTDLVNLAGQSALLANALEPYLSEHAAVPFGSEIRRLKERAQKSSDEQAVRAYRHAAGSRGRQLATCRQLVASRERINARLEAVCASLTWAEAIVVRLRFLSLEQAGLAGDVADDQLDAVREEFNFLERAIEETLDA
jgi:hypothetical protein